MREFYKDKELHGYTIREVLLTKEELAMDITADRLQEVSCEIGENIFEDTGFLGQKGQLLFAGYIMGKYPKHTKDILDATNHQYYDYMSLEELFGEEGGEEAYFELMRVFSEFVNKTIASKERVNIFLISVLNQYRPEKEEKE